MVGHAAALVSFAEASGLLTDLAGVTVDPKAVERSAEALGREVAADERSVVEPVAPSAPTMYLGLDGTGVPMRPAEVAGRVGKGADGTARTREAKLVTVDRGGTRRSGRPGPGRGLGELLGGHRERRHARHR